MKSKPNAGVHSETEYVVLRDSKGAVTKPRQPLSSYNLFFQMERKRILSGADKLQVPVTSEDLRAMLSMQKIKTKRVHRRTHGKISFRQLAKTIALRWKNIDKESRKVFDQQAIVEKQNYVKQLRAWKELEKGASPNTPQTEARKVQTAPQVQEEMTTNESLSQSRLQDLEEVRTFVRDEMARLSAKKGSTSAYPVPINPGSTFPPLFEDIEKNVEVITEYDTPKDDNSDNLDEEFFERFCLPFAGIEPIKLSDENATPSSRVELVKQLSEKSEPIFNEIMFSPIFREASLSGNDLFESLDSEKMDQLFD